MLLFNIDLFLKKGVEKEDPCIIFLNKVGGVPLMGLTYFRMTPCRFLSITARRHVIFSTLNKRIISTYLFATALKVNGLVFAFLATDMRMLNRSLFDIFLFFSFILIFVQKNLLRD